LILNLCGRKAMTALTCLLCSTLGMLTASSWYHTEQCTDINTVRDEAVSFLQKSRRAKSEIHRVGSRGIGGTNKTVDLTQGINAYTQEDDWWAFQKCSAKDALRQRGPASRKPVIWVHLHKTAGTSMCCEAWRREKVVVPAENCNRGMDAWRKWETLEAGPFTTCENRSAYMRDNGFTWAAIERWLDHGDFCPHRFVYATLLREPMSLMMSEADYGRANHEVERRMEWLTNIISCINVGLCRGMKDWFVFDNFLVRTFSGVGFSVPPGGINSSHFHAATAVLRKFKLVLLMDRLNDPRTFRAYERAIGWPFPLDDSSMSSHVNQGKHEILFDSKITKQLRKINAFDLAFFDFAAKTHYS